MNQEELTPGICSVKGPPAVPVASPPDSPCPWSDDCDHVRDSDLRKISGGGSGRGRSETLGLCYRC